MNDYISIIQIDESVLTHSSQLKKLIQKDWKEFSTKRNVKH